MSTSGGFSKARLGRLRDVLAGYVEQGNVPGLVTLVSRRGEVHVETLGTRSAGSGDRMRRDSLFRIASMTKPVTAVAALILLEETKLRLDDPVAPWLPELANRRVLRTLESSLNDTVPASRSITVRDLLTFRMGFGAVMAPPEQYPIQAAIADAGLSPGPIPPSFGPDEWMRRLGALPLLHQPGEQWMYHTASDVLGVLIARVSGQPFEDFLRERIFEPLGMKDTAFFVPEAKLDRLTTAYSAGEEGRLDVYDAASGSVWARPPVFPAGGGGLVSTADDFSAFSRMLLDKGRGGAGRILSRPSVELMTSDHLTPAQKAASTFASGFFDIYGWGFGVSVVTHRTRISETPGRYGWDGGFGTSWRSDPAEDMTLIFLQQKLMTAPDDTRINEDFFTLAYQALDD